MKCSLGISNFLEEISNLSHSIVFHFFALITEEGFLISPCYSLELCIQMGISYLFTSPLSTAICKASSDSHFAFLHFFFLEMVLSLDCKRVDSAEPKPWKRRAWLSVTLKNEISWNASLLNVPFLTDCSEPSCLPWLLCFPQDLAGPEVVFSYKFFHYACTVNKT